MNPRVAVLTDEYTTKRSELDALDALAASEGRDLTPEERTDYDANVTRMEAIEADIDTLAKRQARFDAAAVATTRAVPLGSPARTAPRIAVPSHTEQISLLRRMVHGDEVAKSEWDNITRSLQHGTSADGTAPVTIEGDLIKFVDASRNAVNASRRLPMPDNHASTFKRPRWTTSTLVGVQAAQGDVLASRAPVNTGDLITKATFGGTFALSEQERDWTEPAMVALGVQDLAEQYGIATDDAHCTAIETASTASAATTLSLTAASDAVIAAVAAASGIAYGTSKKMPDVLFAAPDRFFYLAALTDGDGRPVFPVSGGTIVNSAGSNGPGVTSWGSMNVLGLRVVVDPNFTANFLSVAVSNLVEAYEEEKGLLTVEAPSTLETLFAYRGYFASNVYSQGFGALEA